MKLILNCCLAAAVVALSLPLSAAPSGVLSPVLRDSLTRISESLFEAHSNDFIIVEALRDGYLEFDQQYTFNLNTDSAVVIANGRQLPADVSSRYQHRLREFRYYSGNVPNTKFSISYSGEGVSLQNILDPKSSFRKTRTTTPVDPERDHARKNIGRIIAELVRDGVITDQGNFSIEYTAAGLLVNGANLAPAMDEKYRSFFRVFMDVQPKDGKGEYKYSVSSGAVRK